MRRFGILLDAAVRHFGRLKVMVNNADVGSDGKAGEVLLDDWNNTLRVDLTGVFYCWRAALSKLLETRGCIANTALVSGAPSRCTAAPAVCAATRSARR